MLRDETRRDGLTTVACERGSTTTSSTIGDRLHLSPQTANRKESLHSSCQDNERSRVTTAALKTLLTCTLPRRGREGRIFPRPPRTKARCIYTSTLLSKDTWAIAVTSSRLAELFRRYFTQLASSAQGRLIPRAREIHRLLSKAAISWGGASAWPSVFGVRLL